jgi:hypothetical protein
LRLVRWLLQPSQRILSVACKHRVILSSGSTGKIGQTSGRWETKEISNVTTFSHRTISDASEASTAPKGTEPRVATKCVSRLKSGLPIVLVLLAFWK